MPLRTIEQDRAKFAYNCVTNIINCEDDQLKKKYKSLVRKFSSMILQNGLGQALAFLKAKGKEGNNEHTLLYTHINLWLRNYFASNEANFDILNKILNEDCNKYRLYTRETLSFLVWLKKFAEAELSD